MKPVRFLASACEDIRREKSYYKKISPELAHRFQLAVEKAVKFAAEQPLAMQALEFDIRRWLLETFPHGVLYRVEEEFILVLAVFHRNQAPERWQDKGARLTWRSTGVRLQCGFILQLFIMYPFLNPKYALIAAC